MMRGEADIHAVGGPSRDVDHAAVLKFAATREHKLFEEFRSVPSLSVERTKTD